MAIASKFVKYKYEILYTKLIYSNIQIEEVFKFLTHYFIINKHFLFITKFKIFDDVLQSKDSPNLCVISTMI